MRKLTAIFLLGIHLYMLGGYILVRQFIEYRSNIFYNQQVARDLYDKQDVVEIQIPMQMTGIHDMDNYETVSGRVCFKENAYNYIAMKLTNHAMFLKCLPNYKSTRLSTANIIHAEHIKDIPIPPKDHVPEAKFVFMHGFLLAFSTPVLYVPVAIISHTTPEYNNSLISRPVDILKQPPKLS